MVVALRRNNLSLQAAAEANLRGITLSEGARATRKSTGPLIPFT